MKRKTMFLMTIGLAALAGLFMHRYAQSIKAEYGEKEEKVRVLVAKDTLMAGQSLEGKLLASRPVPLSFVPGQAIYASDAEIVVGKEMREQVAKGDYVLWTSLAGTDDSSSLEESIKFNTRALAIPVSPKNAAGGLLMPGDRVDILGTFPDPSNREDVTVTLLQNVAVLAVGNLGASVSDNRRKVREYRSATVRVTVDEAEILTFAMEHGKLAMTLRNPEDSSTEEKRQPKRFSDVLSEESLKKVQTVRSQHAELVD